MVDDLNEVYDALRMAGVLIRQPPTIQVWGVHDVVVVNPNGNSFQIAELRDKPVAPSPLVQTDC
jgi:uncharacterized glyoxalase superfamily protein PhnB